MTELIIPELARCSAAGSQKRIHYLVRKALRTVLVYGITMGGLLFLLSDVLCEALYHNTDAAGFMRAYALLIPMLYCDAITDAMTKGLGQQKICVRYNILTSAMDVIFLYLMLPDYGMIGYYISFTVTHLLNFILSLRRLLKITEETIPFYLPAFSICATVAAVWGAACFSSPILRCVSFLGILWSLLCLLGVSGMDDIRWIRGLLHKK